MDLASPHVHFRSGQDQEAHPLLARAADLAVHVTWGDDRRSASRGRSTTTSASAGWGCEGHHACLAYALDWPPT